MIEPSHSQTKIPYRISCYFNILFNIELGEVSFAPMNHAVYTENGISNNGITNDFSSHRVNIDKLYNLLHNEFNIWCMTDQSFSVNPAQTLTLALRRNAKTLAGSIDGKTVTVTGLVIGYKGRPEIEVREVDELVIK